MYPYPFVSEITRKRIKHRQKYRKKYKKLIVPNLVNESKLSFPSQLPECLSIQQENKKILNNSTIQDLICDEDDDEEFLSKLPFKIYSDPLKEFNNTNVKLPNNLSANICHTLQLFCNDQGEMNNSIMDNLKKTYMRKKILFNDVMDSKGIKRFTGYLCHGYINNVFKQIRLKGKSKVSKKKDVVSSFKMPFYESNSCLYHNGEMRCNLPRDKSKYCLSHNHLYGKIAGNIIKEEERLLFKTVNPCNIAESRSQEYESFYFNIFDIPDTHTYTKHISESLSLLIDNLAAKEMFLRIRTSNYKRMKQYYELEDEIIKSQLFIDEVKQSGFEYITNIESVETALEVIRMQEFNDLPDDVNETDQYIDEYVDEFDAHNIWESLGNKNHNEIIQCDCGQIILEGENCICLKRKPDENMFDAYIDVMEDEVQAITYNIVKDELRKLPLDKVQQLVYHSIPWKSVMRGELDPECYLEYNENELPRRSGELLLCESEGYTFSEKITFSDINSEQGITIKNSEIKKVKTYPESTYDIKIFSLPFVQLPGDITDKASSYEMSWSFSYYDAKFNANLMMKNNSLDWNTHHWVGLINQKELDELIEAKNKLNIHREEEINEMEAAKIDNEQEIVRSIPVQYRPMSNIVISTRDPNMPLLTPMSVEDNWNKSQPMYVRQQTPQTVYIEGNDCEYQNVYFTTTPQQSSASLTFTTQYHPENGYSRVRYYQAPKNVGTVG